MGRWTESEFDRVLLLKVRTLFESCRDPLVESDDTDLRFRTFIKRLDPSDKAIQACMRSLIQQSHSPTRSNRGRPISEYLEGVDFPPARTQRHTIAPGEVHVRSPPPRISTRELRRQLRPRDTYHEDILTPSVGVTRPRERSSAVAQYLAEARQRDSSTLTLPPIRPSVSSELSERQSLLPQGGPSSAGASRPHSPSRMRRLGLDPSITSFVPRGPAPPSPPSAASRAWLDDYTVGSGDDGHGAAMLGRMWAAPDLGRPIRPAVRYVPGDFQNVAFNRPGRRPREEFTDEQEAEDREARYAQYAARHWQMAERTAARNEEARAMRANNVELEAMFGPWEGGSDSDDASTYPRLFEPVTDRPQPIPDSYYLNEINEGATWLEDQTRALRDGSRAERDTRRDGLVLEGFTERGSAAALLEQQIFAHEAAMADLEVDTPPSVGDVEYGGPEGGPGEWVSDVDWRL